MPSVSESVSDALDSDRPASKSRFGVAEFEAPSLDERIQRSYRNVVRTLRSELPADFLETVAQHAHRWTLALIDRS